CELGRRTLDVPQSPRRVHARRCIRSLRIRSSPADRGVERSLSASLLYGRDRVPQSRDLVPSRGLSLSPRAVPPVAPPDGDRALADRQPAVLLTGPLARHVGFF